MAGKKETPPSRDTGLLCTFRASGVSNRRLRREMIKIRGMMIQAKTTAIRKAATIIRIFSMMLCLVPNVFDKFYTMGISFFSFLIYEPSPLIEILNDRANMIP